MTSILLAALTQVFPKTKVLGQEPDLNSEELLNIKWRVPQEQVRTVEEELEEFDLEIEGDNSTIVDTKGLPLIYIVIGIVAVGQLAETLLKIYRDVKYGGVIVFVDEDENLNIENDLRLPTGTLIISSKDGIEVFQEKNEPQLIEVIKVLAKVRK